MIEKNQTDEIINYLSDAANVQGKCNSVIIVENPGEARSVIEEANKSQTYITISGNGTGLTGGRVPLDGIVLSTEKLNKIIAIDKSNYTALVEPGVVLSDFQKEIAQLGLFYPPDPTETNCFIGGTIANNSSGAKSFKYGSTRKFVQALKIILPNGDLLRIRRGEAIANNYFLELIAESGNIYKLNLPRYNMPDVKNAAGYFTGPQIDAIDLFIGAEGTLGLIIEAELKLLEQPEDILSAVLFFDEESDALDFIDRARYLSKEPNKQSLIDALGIEFFDKRSLIFLKADYPNIPENTTAVWFEQTLNYNNNLIVNAWTDLALEHNANLSDSWIAIDASDRNKFINFRHAVSSKVSDYVSVNGITKIGTDTAVPVEHFRQFYNTAVEWAKESGIDFINYGHFGDCHMHLNMLPANSTEFETAKALYKKICELSVNLGGTISAEHGIGKLKRDYLKLMYTEEEIAGMASVKRVLDPNRILNIGNIFEEKYLFD